jgi:hypothetical protein
MPGICFIKTQVGLRRREDRDKISHESTIVDAE